MQKLLEASCFSIAMGVRVYMYVVKVAVERFYLK